MDSLPRLAKRRAARACERCHSRKVRCDGSVTGFPCTNCRLDRFPCNAFSGLGKRAAMKHLFRSSATPSSDSSHASPPSPIHHNPLSQAKLMSSVFARISLPFSSYSFLRAPTLRQLDSAVATFLESQGSLHVPTQDALDTFIRHYFLYVHPCLPILDEAAFWRKYRCPRAGDDGVSILLFQAMLFAASCFVPVEVARQCGYKSLISARDDLYRRTKLLYESGLEDEPLTISRASLLLTYYTSDTNTSANSEWLSIAIKYAKAEQANWYYCTASQSIEKRCDLKRVWWCCLIRDRTISLGMRRPVQITPEEFDLHQEGLTAEDLEDETFNSEVYRSDTKTALCHVLASLCHLAVSVTDLAMIIYPASQTAVAHSKQDRSSELERLEEAKSALLRWELDWMAHMEGKDFGLHSSVALCTNLVAMYYLSARIALCNHMCLLIGEAHSLEENDLERIESCRSELVTAIGSTADKVKQLITNGVADKLPISAVAYTILPQILLSIKTELSTTPEDKQNHEVALVFFVEINRLYSSRYYTKRILALAWRALRLCQQPPTITAASPASIEAHCSTQYPNLFELRLTEYTRLLRYVDGCMSAPQNNDHAIDDNWIPRPDPIPSTSLTLTKQAVLPKPNSSSGPRPMETAEPVWMEAMESFFFGPGTLQQSSPTQVQPGTKPGHSPGDSEQTQRDESESYGNVLGYLPLLGE